MRLAYVQRIVIHQFILAGLRVTHRRGRGLARGVHTAVRGHIRVAIAVCQRGGTAGHSVRAVTAHGAMHERGLCLAMCGLLEFVEARTRVQTIVSYAQTWLERDVETYVGA